MMQQVVKVRKYAVDVSNLKKCLREHKTLTNQEISIHLNIPLSQVEHYFRKDECFAIPDSQLWFDLKALLNIETTEFDESIMTFIEHGGAYEKSKRVYYTNTDAPTILANTDGEKIIQVTKI